MVLGCFGIQRKHIINHPDGDWNVGSNSFPDRSHVMMVGFCWDFIQFPEPGNSENPFLFRLGIHWISKPIQASQGMIVDLMGASPNHMCHGQKSRFFGGWSSHL